MTTTPTNFVDEIHGTEPWTTQDISTRFARLRESFEHAGRTLTPDQQNVLQQRLLGSALGVSVPLSEMAAIGAYQAYCAQLDALAPTVAASAARLNACLAVERGQATAESLTEAQAALLAQRAEVRAAQQQEGEPA